MDHARQVRRIYEECGYRAAEICSEMDEDEKEMVFNKLQFAQLDCIVQVPMLGEGFDHPKTTWPLYGRDSARRRRAKMRS